MTNPEFHVAQPEDYRGAHSTPRSESVITGDRYRITVLTEALLRIEWSATGAFEDRPSTFAIFRDLPTPAFTVARGPRGIRVQTERFDLTYDEQPFSTAGLQVQVRGGVTAHKSTWRYQDDTSYPAWRTQPAPEDRVPASNNLGGTATTLDDADGPIPLNPGVNAEQGYAVIDDTDSMLFTADGWVAPRPLRDRAAYEDLYLFTHGHDFADAVADFYRVSGTQPAIPRWALGNWWSRYHRYTADDYLALFDRFEAERLPFSVAVLDMDWHVTDVDPRFGPGWTGYSWNRELFPDPAGLLAELHRRGLRTTLNDHPADGIQPHEDVYPAMAESMGIDPTTETSVLFDAADRTFMENYHELVLGPLERDGVDFWWLDWQSGSHSRVPGVDPLWVLNHMRYLQNDRPGQVPLAFSRYAGPGSHRYPVGFSGDTVTTWESLDFQPYFTANAANIGYGWWSHDIGGHMMGYRDDELTARWAQYGVFSPILRLHSQASRFQGKEPWNLPSPYREVVSDALRLRHRLVPYLHTMNRTLPSQGVPLVQPVYHRYPGYAPRRHPNTYLFGTELFVAPITSPVDHGTRRASVTAWLPPGQWFDLFTGYRYDGDRDLTFHRDLGSIPVLLRAGGIVPMAPETWRADSNPVDVTLAVAAGGSSVFTLVEDDGGDAMATTRIEVNPGTARIVVHAPEGAGDVLPESRNWCLELIGFADLHDVWFDGAGRLVRAERVSPTRQVVEVRDVPRGHGFTVGGISGVGRNPVHQEVESFLHQAQIGNMLKEAIADRVHEHGVAALSGLATLRAPSPTGLPEPYATMDPETLSVITELLLASVDD